MIFQRPGINSLSQYDLLKTWVKKNPSGHDLPKTRVKRKNPSPYDLLKTRD
jgi:hypothetical protein